jgi:hypothetical protein
MYPLPIQSYKEQFLLTQQHQHQRQKRMSNSRAATREESLMSIADAIRPPDPRPEIDSPGSLVAMRRGHSVSRDDDLGVISFPDVDLAFGRLSWIWQK